MKGVIYLFIIALLITGCNIVPKSVQYQNEEEKIIGSVEIANPRVEEIQLVLLDLKYDIGRPDGRMGEDTRQAIKEFQESMGLKSTGYINERTLRAIEEIRREKDDRALLKSDYTIEVKSAYPEKEGLKEEPEITTRNIQVSLKNAGFDPGPIDGKMGKRTRQAVMEFQKTKGLKIDGVVGPKTWAELKKYLKK